MFPLALSRFWPAEFLSSLPAGDRKARAGGRRSAPSLPRRDVGALPGKDTFAAERELSQLAAGGRTRDGSDNFDVCLSGGALRIGTIRAPGTGGRASGRPCARVAVCKDPAKGSLRWTNGAIRLAKNKFCRIIKP